ncbi:diphthine--ammonia ligase [Nonomuraea candida]|uniref:Dph6-related ATP pyrophosphatase n=1 Tax=Nonomuraea candida TaxID=359159 RepID=UPI0005BB86CE|nr:diphthine--ammonia ligase [Nonomuraea candida]
METGDRFFTSWSGGKDSAIALHHAVRDGGIPELLITMMTETGERSRSHGLSRDLLTAQAQALGIPVRFAAATWADYEDTFQKTVSGAVQEGLHIGVFGDMDIESHREWVVSTCARAGAAAELPLWGRERAGLMAELVAEGFQAVLVAVREPLLSPDLLGQVIDRDMIRHFGEAGVDLAGEKGEYHTVVVDGPIFRRPLPVTLGEKVLRDGVWFVDITAGSPGDR